METLITITVLQVLKTDFEANRDRIHIAQLKTTYVFPCHRKGIFSSVTSVNLGKFSSSPSSPHEESGMGDIKYGTQSKELY